MPSVVLSAAIACPIALAYDLVKLDPTWALCRAPDPQNVRRRPGPEGLDILGTPDIEPLRSHLTF